MPVVVTGKTWDIRDRLKSLGGRWNADNKGWEFYTLSPEHRSEFKAHVGVMIADKPGDPGPSHQSPRHTPMTEQRRKPITDADTLIANAMDSYRRERRQAENDRKTNMFGDDPTWFNYFADQNPIGFWGFSSLSAMVKYLENLPESDRNGCGWESRDFEWTKTECMVDAIDIARKGWNEGVELAQEVHEQLIGRHANQRRRKHSVSGGSVNIGRLLAGNPDHMISRPKQPGKKVITFFVEGFMSSGIDSENAIIRAALIGAIADILEINGFSCEIVSITTTLTIGRDGIPAFQVATMLKAAGETLDLNDVIFGLGHPSFCRRFCFGCVGSDHDLRNVWRYMGAPSRVFTASHSTKANEFFIDKINLADQGKIDDSAPLINKAMQIFDIVFKQNLPIELKEDIDA